MKPKIEIVDNELRLDNRALYFVKNEYDYFKPDQIQINETDSGYEFELESPVPTTMVVPCLYRRLIIGDSYQEINYNAIKGWYCHGPTSLIKSSELTDIYSSVFHSIGEYAWSFSVFGECRIDYYTKDYERYISITGIPDKDRIKFYLDVSENYQANMYRPKVKRRVIEQYNVLDIDEMKDIIYYGSRVEEKDFDAARVINRAKDVQSIFEEDDLFSVITGSLAQRLNGIDCFVRDVDFMLKSRPAMVHASELLQQTGYELKKETDKWMSLTSNDKKIDLSWDNYRLLQLPYYVRNHQGLTFFDTEGLLWLAMSNLFEQTRHPYSDSYPRNNRALFELTRHAFTRGITCNAAVGAEIEDFDTFAQNCKDISKKLSALEILYKDTRINEPFRANCFGSENNRTFSVINVGTESDFRLVTDMNVRESKWLDISGRSENATVENHDGFSMVFMNNIIYPGILMCQ